MTDDHDDIPVAELDESLSARPDNIPEKFWDRESESVRIDALANSYAALERKLSSADSPQVMAPEPDSGKLDAEAKDTGADYAIATEHGMFESHPEINAVLREAGFTQDQAQLVYDLAANVMLPALSDIAESQSTQADENRLAQHFGGIEKWHETRRQLRIWGERHLPPEALSSLSANYDGVLALHRLMQGEEPSVLRGDNISDAVDQGGLRRMIRDPKYWRDRDPAIVRKVRDGFKRLYPDS